MRSRGIVVYLQAPIETLLTRTHRDRSRPLLQDGDRRAKFEEILKARDPLYRATADVIVVTDHRSPLTVAQEIAAKIQGLELDENAAG
jgi:shikimate kinase